MVSIRALFVFRTFVTSSPYATDRAFRVCQMFGAKPGYGFTFRCFMKDYPMISTFTFMFGGVCLFGWWVLIAESPINRLGNPDESMMHNDYLSTCWVAIVTMTTVGYGDMYPRTYLGRMVMIMCAIYGTVVFSLLVVVVTNTMNMNSFELQSWTVLRKLQ